MKLLENIFGLKKKSSKKNIKNNQLSNSSISSLSSTSTSDSQPRTPNEGLIEQLGIFRTLEPVWYFHSSLLPSNNHKEEWLRFDDSSQYNMEQSYMRAKSECVLHQTVIGPCQILFKQTYHTTKRYSMMHTKTDHHLSMPTLQQPQQQSNYKKLELNKHVRRTISPIWWFEQDSYDGTKGMCRFDYKNQVRLEALSEGRTKLVLTDDSFPSPFTVVLEPPKPNQKELKEELRGFLYLELTSNPLLYQQPLLKDEQYNEFEQWETTLVRRFSI